MDIKSLPDAIRAEQSMSGSAYSGAEHVAYKYGLEVAARRLETALPKWTEMDALDKATQPDDGELVLVVTQYHEIPEFAEWSEPTGQFNFPATDGYISRNDGLIRWRHMCDLDTP